MHGDPTVCTVVLSPCDLSFEYWGDIMIGLACNCMNLIARSAATISFSHIATPCMNPNLMHKWSIMVVLKKLFLGIVSF